MHDPFEILGLERRFDLDLSLLEKTHRDLSRAIHPDKAAQAGASERRALLDRAATVNEAFRILRDPIRRAEALFRLAGMAVGEDHEPKSSPAFLMDVLEQREALAEARANKDLAKVDAIGKATSERMHAAETKLARGFEAFRGASSQTASGAATGSASELDALLPLLGELRFYKRVLDEVSAIEEENE